LLAGDTLGPLKIIDGQYTSSSGGFAACVVLPLLGTISGGVLVDTDKDGIGDSTLENVLVTVTDSSGYFLASVFTKADGTNKFTKPQLLLC
jgi:hypothetical protein